MREMCSLAALFLQVSGCNSIAHRSLLSCQGQMWAMRLTIYTI